MKTYTPDEIRQKIATHDYSAELLLQHAMANIEQLERQLAAKQAELDRIMLEFCPDEMTPEQLKTWGENQRPYEG